MYNQNGYIKGCRIGNDSFYNNIYKVQNKQSGCYNAMKEIQKSKIKNINENELIEIINNFYQLKTENSICMKEYINTQKYLYIYMDYCEYN